MTNLDTLRRTFGKVLIAFLWLHLPVVALGAWFCCNALAPRSWSRPVSRGCVR
ncbi:hypothetical protein [Methylobacterium flocculans]|uniref:hypothetical protein n=1 Tax=Methylobacterium flocculans TaxID=2984843 RepID=UPI0021F25D0C|nr:hypothetical protein [Methylobacterium sp. FF17]